MEPRDNEEQPRAYVALRDFFQIASEQDIAAWLSQRVAPYKKLNGGVRFVDNIPRTSSGKILRKILRQKATAEVAADGVTKKRYSRL